MAGLEWERGEGGSSMAGMEWERGEGGSASDCDGDGENVSVMNCVL